MNPTETDRRIIFSESATMSALRRREAGDIVYAVNVALASRKVLTHARIHRLSYNEKGNQSGLMGKPGTTSMILPILRETVMKMARNADIAIIDVTGDQKWDRIRVHSVYLERYGREPGGIELLQ